MIVAPPTPKAVHNTIIISVDLLFLIIPYFLAFAKRLTQKNLPRRKKIGSERNPCARFPFDKGAFFKLSHLLVLFIRSFSC